MVLQGDTLTMHACTHALRRLQGHTATASAHAQWRHQALEEGMIPRGMWGTRRQGTCRAQAAHEAE